MGFFDLFRLNDINKGVEEYKNTEGAVLLDVRTREEYEAGHIEGSTNIPVEEIRTILDKIKDKNTPLFVHCLSGARSGSAVLVLGNLGYTNVKNIGGIASYRGKLVE
ncbi:MAG: rhodanese-like domain-containing protein [Sphaerochaetaceae bacterium]|nr:rhodanese-like domain-containing protein [Sphaerochaetaceae bacterium]